MAPGAAHGGAAAGAEAEAVPGDRGRPSVSVSPRRDAWTVTSPPARARRWTGRARKSWVNENSIALILSKRLAPGNILSLVI